MGYRSSKNRLEAIQDWHTFVAHNREIIERAGLPAVVTESIKLWDDFLKQGRLDHYLFPSWFTVDQLAEEQYAALLKLLDSYFARGYEYFTPVVLRVEDSQKLEMRYRNH